MGRFLRLGSMKGWTSILIMCVVLASKHIFANHSNHLLAFLKKDFKEIGGYFSGIEGLDKIYVINLDHKIDRKRHMDNLLTSYGLQYERFSAVNGWAFDKILLRKFYVQCLPPVQDRRFISPGQIGCFLSHLSIIKQALDKGYETIWVLEDDIVFNKDPKKILEEFIFNMAAEKIEWDILFTDLNSRYILADGSIGHYIVFRGSLGSDFDYESAGSMDVAPTINFAKQIQHRLGAYSIVLSRRGMIKIFNYFMKHPLQSAYDVDWNFFENTRFFQLLEDVVTTNSSESSTTP